MKLSSAKRLIERVRRERGDELPPEFTAQELMFQIDQLRNSEGRPITNTMTPNELANHMHLISDIEKVGRKRVHARCYKNVWSFQGGSE